MFPRGKLVTINAKVHNQNEAGAENVNVAFYNGNPDNGGYLIGNNEIPEIGGFQSGIASINWWVPLEDSLNVFIKVDPNNVIEESSENNNIANRLLDEKSIDSDGDGLTDYDERSGMRTAMNLIFYTDPANPDTDGDGLDDGKEMGPVMEEKRGIFESDHYYFLFSYPSTDVLGRVISDSSDSDNDGLPDMEEYDFGSSGIDKDTDLDKLNDLEEKNEGTLPRDPDTDRDGLSNWYETVTDSGAKLYGGTDPLNRDSDNDGAIDGGDSNVYPSTPLDINNDAEVGSEKQTDLDGGG